jgi:DNA polymerase elongation subunit (family B)
MILDIENLGNRIKISYFNEEGKIELKTFNIDQPTNWTVCSERDPNKSDTYRNWDGKSVKQDSDKRLNKWSVYEFIESLPDHERKPLQALNFPAVQSIDIETEVIDGFPVPEIAKERITTIAIATESNSTLVLGWKPIDKEQEKKIYDQHAEYLKEHGDWKFKYICFETEFDMMYTFIHKFLPNFSLVIGWNFMNFDWKYIWNRCGKLGIDPGKASPSGKVSRNDNIPLHIGMIDYLDMYRRWDRTIAIKENNTLDFVAGAVLGVTKLKYNGTLQELYEKDYDKYILYNAIDSALVCLIHKKLRTTNAVFSMANMCNLPLYKASSAVNLTEALLWKGYYEKDMVIADLKMETPRGSYEGAYVKEPEPGIFRAATCFDYASLYPSIMRQYNISPESFVVKHTDEERLRPYRDNEDYIVSVTGSVYDNKKTSVLKEILTDLYSKRKFYKNRHLEIERKLSKLKK